MTPIWSIVVPGRPIQKGNKARIAKRRDGGMFIMPAATAKKAEDRARMLIAPTAPVDPFVGPLVVDVTFVFKIPKTGDNKNRQEGEPCLKRVDRGNLLKMIEDAMSGLVYLDDSQICGGDVRKVWGREEQTEVRVYRWQP